MKLAAITMFLDALIMLNCGRMEATEAVDCPRTYQRLIAAQPTTVVCFGDSVTGVYYHTGGLRAYPELIEIALRKQFPKCELRVINAGVSGDTTSLGLARLEKDVLEREPHLVTVMFGLNDMKWLPLEQFRSNLVEIAKRVSNRGAEVLFCTPNSIESSSDRPVARLAEFVAATNQVGSELRLPVADVFSAWEQIRAADATGFTLLLSDTVHPNLDGHKQTAAMITQAVGRRKTSLKAEKPPQLAIPRTCELLAQKRPIKIFAMSPYDASILPMLQALDPAAEVQVTAWPVAGKSIAEIEEDAKQVRDLHPDLVIVAVPYMNSIASPTAFARSYGWILNRSLSYGEREWDVLAFPPSLVQPARSDQQRSQDQLVQRLISAQDLSLIVRSPNDDRSATDLLSAWFQDQRAIANRKQKQ